MDPPTSDVPPPPPVTDAASSRPPPSRVPPSIRPVEIAAGEIFVTDDSTEVVARLGTLQPHLDGRICNVVSVPAARPDGWTEKEPVLVYASLFLRRLDCSRLDIDLFVSLRPSVEAADEIVASGLVSVSNGRPELMRTLTSIAMARLWRKLSDPASPRVRAAAPDHCRTFNYVVAALSGADVRSPASYHAALDAQQQRREEDEEDRKESVQVAE